jgi:hypothetical protein
MLEISVRRRPCGAPNGYFVLNPRNEETGIKFAHRLVQVVVGVVPFSLSVAECSSHTSHKRREGDWAYVPAGTQEIGDG